MLRQAGTSPLADEKASAVPGTGLRSTEFAGHVLGYAGLLPFGMLAAASFLAGPWSEAAFRALIVWGAVILSFVGAVHWGLKIARHVPGSRSGHPQNDGLPEQRNAVEMAVSIVPSAIAFVGVLIGGAPGGVVLALGFAGFYAYERFTATRTKLPGWYLRLRTYLTAGACGAIGTGSLAVTALN